MTKKMTKQCSSCKQELSKTLFKHYGKSDYARVCNICKDPDNFGYKYCPKCGEQKPLDRYNKRKDSPNRKYQSTCRDCVSQYQREYRAVNRYGMTHTEMLLVRDTQQGLCAICQQELPLVADHCHESGKFRAFLCDKCNRGLGYFDDLSERLLSASNYLKKYGR